MTKPIVVVLPSSSGRQKTKAKTENVANNVDAKHLSLSRQLYQPALIPPKKRSLGIYLCIQQGVITCNIAGDRLQKYTVAKKMHSPAQ